MFFDEDAVFPDYFEVIECFHCKNGYYTRLHPKPRFSMFSLLSLTVLRKG
jgi:hypothetical protein